MRGSQDFGDLFRGKKRHTVAESNNEAKECME